MAQDFGSDLCFGTLVLQADLERENRLVQGRFEADQCLTSAFLAILEVCLLLDSGFGVRRMRWERMDQLEKQEFLRPRSFATTQRDLELCMLWYPY